MVSAVAQKPSFGQSVVSGMGGYLKAFVATAIVGTIAATGLLGLGALVVGFESALLAAPLAAGLVAAIAGTAGIAGAVTGVLQTREAAAPSAKDVIGVAKIAYEKGIQVGHQMGHAHEQQKSAHQDKLRVERQAAAALTGGPVKV